MFFSFLDDPISTFFFFLTNNTIISLYLSDIVQINSSLSIHSFIQKNKKKNTSSREMIEKYNKRRDK